VSKQNIISLAPLPRAWRDHTRSWFVTGQVARGRGV